jgi:putative ABC transport system ATP-binding protein
MMPSLDVRVRDLFKVYRIGRIEVQALRGLNMTVERGEVVSIMGPSGSGKTTLLNVIGGLDRATAGSVWVGDLEVNSLSTPQLIKYRRNTVGHIFQGLNLIPTLTAAENVELPMTAAGMPRAKKEERVRALLDAVGLANRADHKPDELSGGEQQRVAIATAIANDPPVILADEPTGELDSVNAKTVVDFLVKVSKEMDKTTLVVTHDPNVARATDRIMRIEDGVIKASFAPAQIVEEAGPASYADQLRARIAEIDAQLGRLDASFRQGLITGDEYTEQRLRLRQSRSGLADELRRLGE